MYKYIISILIFIVFLIITVINLNGDNISLNLILFKTPALPGIVFVYIGIVLGAIITMPIMVIQTKKKDSKVLTQHMKNETKRMKQKAKKTEEQAVLKGNINPPPPPT